MRQNRMPARRAAARTVLAGGPAIMVLVAVVLVAGLTACAFRPVHGNPASSPPGSAHAVHATQARAISGHQPRRPSAVFQTTRTFQLGAGHATRTFTFREQSGVIMRDQLTVQHGARVVVDARIPDVAEATVRSWAARDDPSLSCRRDGRVDVCTQAEQWCPMPQATWYFRLVKVSGPAGPVRLDYVIAAPPTGFSG